MASGERSRIEADRIEAVRRVLGGESASTVARSLSRSEQWVRKWVNRWDPGNSDWFISQSRAPITVANRVPAEVEELVVSIRRELADSPWAQIGSAAIAWELDKLDTPNPPSLRTIERILERCGVERGVSRGGYQAKGTAYPGIDADEVNAVHQADVVGPRYVQGKECFYAFNAIDVARRKLAGEITTAKSADALCDATIKTWERLGIPDRIQLDNQQALAGAKGRPGKLVRLCLTYGVTPTFIPFAEPWRNGVVEHYHRIFNRQFYRTETFTSIDHVTDRYRQFEAFHNSHHRYSALGGATPNQADQHATIPLRYPTRGTVIPDDFTGLSGTVIWIRLIRSDQQLHILERVYPMPEHVTHEYVTATLDVATERLTVTHQDHPIATHPFPLHETMC